MTKLLTKLSSLALCEMPKSPKLPLSGAQNPLLGGRTQKNHPFAGNRKRVISTCIVQKNYSSQLCQTFWTSSSSSMASMSFCIRNLRFRK